jgi:hypothetical protein
MGTKVKATLTPCARFSSREFGLKIAITKNALAMLSQPSHFNIAGSETGFAGGYSKNRT